MMTFDEAWDWYVKTRKQLELLGRVGRRHWDHLPWAGELGRDEKLKRIEADDIVADTGFSLDHLDDFAVLILFSAFESILRDRARADIQEDRERLVNPLATRILDEAVHALEQSSVFRILDLYRSQDANLVEEVNQVRRYRNWVAHGRRGQCPTEVDPESAYGRLRRFLTRFVPPTPEDQE